MEGDLKWLAGILIGVVGLIGGFITRDRQMAKTIREGDEQLHQRINGVKDEYVRKDDLDQTVQRLETGMKEMRDEIRHNNSETTKRLDKILEGQAKR